MKNLLSFHLSLFSCLYNIDTLVIYKSLTALKDPIICIPVTYFIGENGLPLEVIGGDLPVDDFVSRANKALEVLHVTVHSNTNTVQNSLACLQIIQ